MELKANLAKAIIQVMKAIRNIEKNATVGTGNYAYDGVSDKDVKEAVRDVMTEAGLTILPIGVEPKLTVDRWEENGKSKQSVFTEVVTKYLLLHESGESVELEGYGQGVDTQDKGAGKATTYALKNTLLYTFLIPTGKIDDTDSHHSNDKEVPPYNATKSTNGQAVDKPFLNPNTPEWTAALEYLQKEGTKIETIEKKYKIGKVYREKLIEEASVIVGS